MNCPELWRVPVRVDLAGGTLDLWPIYALMEGCITVNAAVDLWIEIEVERQGAGFQVESRDLGVGFNAETWPEATPRQELSWVWRVMNDASLRPARLTLRSPVPQGSGLGTSSCMGVGLLGACEGLEAGPELAARVPLLRDLEARELRTPTGWQDYFPAALGGCLALHWDLPQPRWESLAPHPELLEDLVVFYTGKPHHSGLTNWEAYRRFIEGDAATRRALEEIRDITLEMVRAVPRDAAAVGALLEREGQARCRLSPAVETDAMRAVRDRGRREGWYAGMKPCGAGGGGCCILVTPKGRRDEACAALASMGLPPMDVSLTSKGLHKR